jgi:endogenous inhibitor of DNA gyrase (YacG/DUF329 family)
MNPECPRCGKPIANSDTGRPRCFCSDECRQAARRHAGETRPTPAEDATDLIPSTRFEWRRDGIGWTLFSGRRRVGRVVPDGKHPGMWRSILSAGRLSDMANLSWTRNAVLEVARRELAYELRPATTPSKCPETGGVFESAAPQAAIGASAESSVLPTGLEPCIATAVASATIGGQL